MKEQELKGCFLNLKARGHLGTKPFIFPFSSEDEERGHYLPQKDAENSFFYSLS